MDRGPKKRLQGLRAALRRDFAEYMDSALAPALAPRAEPPPLATEASAPVPTTELAAPPAPTPMQAATPTPTPTLMVATPEVEARSGAPELEQRATEAEAAQAAQAEGAGGEAPSERTVPSRSRRMTVLELLLDAPPAGHATTPKPKRAPRLSRAPGRAASQGAGPVVDVHDFMRVEAPDGPEGGRSRSVGALVRPTAAGGRAAAPSSGCAAAPPLGHGVAAAADPPPGPSFGVPEAPPPSSGAPVVPPLALRPCDDAPLPAPAPSPPKAGRRRAADADATSDATTTDEDVGATASLAGSTSLAPTPAVACNSGDEVAVPTAAEARAPEAAAETSASPSAGDGPTVEDLRQQLRQAEAELRQAEFDYDAGRSVQLRQHVIPALRRELRGAQGGRTAPAPGRRARSSSVSALRQATAPAQLVGAYPTALPGGLRGGGHAVGRAPTRGRGGADGLTSAVPRRVCLGLMAPAEEPRTAPSSPQVGGRPQGALRAASAAAPAAPARLPGESAALGRGHAEAETVVHRVSAASTVHMQQQLLLLKQQHEQHLRQLQRPQGRTPGVG